MTFHVWNRCWTVCWVKNRNFSTKKYLKQCFDKFIICSNKWSRSIGETKTDVTKEDVTLLLTIFGELAQTINDKSSNVWRIMFDGLLPALLNISFMNFCFILSLDLSFVCSFVRSFVFQYLFHQCLRFLSLSNFHHQVGPISIQLVSCANNRHLSVYFTRTGFQAKINFFCYIPLEVGECVRRTRVANTEIPTDYS